MQILRLRKNAYSPGAPSEPISHLSTTTEATEAGARAETPSETGGAASALVAAGIFLSRIAGLIRDRIFARFFGTTLYADVFSAGLRMPNVLQNLLGEGTLSASFIPVYAELLEKGREKEAGKVAGAIFSLLLAVAGGLALIGVLFAPLLVSVFLPGFDGARRELTITVTRIIFPMTGVLVLSAWSLGILNSHRRFFIPYVAPVLWNGAMIATLLIFGGVLDQGPSDLVIALAWGALAGGVLQFLVQLPWVLRLERELHISWNTRLAGVRTAVRNAGPAILGRGVVQFSTWVDMVLASLLAFGAVAAIRYAQTLYVLPISLFGMSVAAAELPELSRRRGGATEVLRDRTSDALRRVYFYVIPSFVGFLLLGDIIVAAIFQTGEFDRADTLLVYTVLAGYTLGLLASTATRVFSSAFFALHDTRTPARIAALRVAVATGVGFLLMVQFERVELFGIGVGPGLLAEWRIGDQPLGAVGLAAGAGIAAWMEWGLLFRSLRGKVGAVGAGWGTIGRMFAAALAAAAAGWGVRFILPPVHPIALAVLVLGMYGIVYFGVAALLGLREARLVGERAERLLRLRR